MILASKLDLENQSNNRRLRLPNKENLSFSSTISTDAENEGNGKKKQVVKSINNNISFLFINNITMSLKYIIKIIQKV